MDRYDPYTDSFIVDTSNIDQFYVRTVQLVELTDECIEKIVNKIAEVKHERQRGEWIPHPLEKGGMSIDRDVCSICGVQIADAWMFDYCPICGSYMRGDEDERKFMGME